MRAETVQCRWILGRSVRWSGERSCAPGSGRCRPLRKAVHDERVGLAHPRRVLHTRLCARARCRAGVRPRCRRDGGRILARSCEHRLGDRYIGPGSRGCRGEDLRKAHRGLRRRKETRGSGPHRGISVQGGTRPRMEAGAFRLGGDHAFCPASAFLIPPKYPLSF